MDTTQDTTTATETPWHRSRRAKIALILAGTVGVAMAITIALGGGQPGNQNIVPLSAATPAAVATASERPIQIPTPSTTPAAETPAAAEPAAPEEVPAATDERTEEGAASSSGDAPSTLTNTPAVAVAPPVQAPAPAPAAAPVQAIAPAAPPAPAAAAPAPAAPPAVTPPRAFPDQTWASINALRTASGVPGFVAPNAGCSVAGSAWGDNLDGVKGAPQHTETTLRKAGLTKTGASYAPDGGGSRFGTLTIYNCG